MTNSVLTYLENQGEDITALLESASLPEEFLRDPSYWMQSGEMEKFLERVAAKENQDGQLFERIANSIPQHRSWGVFDSVLRMMPFKDMFAQPSRFMSYFISPEPPVENIVRKESGIAFDLPVPSEQFPYTTAFLKLALQTLPVFSGQEAASCHWQGVRLSIEWESQQKNIFEADPGHHISPELMRSVVSQLENHQQELEHKNADLEARNEQLRKAYSELEEELKNKMSFSASAEMSAGSAVPNIDFVESHSVAELRNQISRLGDYMVRAQQLMTILIGNQRMAPPIAAAIKKTNWDYVKSEFPKTMASCFEILKQTEEKNNLHQKNNQEKSHV